MEAPVAPTSRIDLVRAASKSLSLFAERDPEGRRLVDEAAALPDAVGYRDLARGAAADGGWGELRRFKRMRLLEIAAHDLAAEADVERVGRALADLADAVVAAGLDLVGDAGGLGVIAMGKLGGQELNYCSDIDLVFVSSGDLDVATKAAGTLLSELGDVHPEGRAYEIDTALRPEGRSGPLVRSVESFAEHHRRRAQPWEHQALIKARHCAGSDEATGRALVCVEDVVWTTTVTPDRVAAVRAMKERVEQHARRSARRAGAEDRDDVKLGPGGIRDIEFSVQLLQLVHGGSDPAVRARATLDVIRALVDGGYVAEEDGAGLSVAYRWLRTVEHRLQLWQERRVRHLPRTPADRTRLARVLGFKDSPGASAGERFEAAHASVLADVRGRFEKLFYRPMIESLADPAGGGLSGDALRERLAFLGFRDVDRAASVLEQLVAGGSRRARLFRVLTPPLLRELATTPSPDHGLFSFLRLGEAVEGRVDVLAPLRDNPPGIELLARVLGAGRYPGEVLLHVPEAVAAIADVRSRRELKSRDRLVREATAMLEWRDPAERLDGLRRFKRRETFEILRADIAGQADEGETGSALADLGEACLEAAAAEIDADLAVIAMGKFGGRELGYGSDLDVVFVTRGDVATAERSAEAILRAIGEITPEGQVFRIDAALRPEGRSGPLVRSLDSFVEYFERWSHPWEHLALLKARPAAGDLETAAAAVAATRRWAWPETPAPEALAEIRHLKARMERERIPRGVDPRRHLKLGPGGMTDVEFAVQIVQLRRAHADPGLRTTSTLDAIAGAEASHDLDQDAARVLREGYKFLMRLRNRLFLLLARPVDVLPTRPEDLETLGVALEFRGDPRQELEDAYLRTTRRIRRLTEELIYGA